MLLDQFQHLKFTILKQVELSYTKDFMSPIGRFSSKVRELALARKELLEQVAAEKAEAEALAAKFSSMKVNS